MKTFEELSVSLFVEFGIITLTAAEFFGYEGEGLWITNNPDKGGLPLFNSNGWEVDPEEKVWVLGTARTLFDYLKEEGYFVESYDAETHMIYKIN